MSNTVLAGKNLKQNDTFDVMPDLSGVIEFFDGDKDADRAGTWIENIETSAKLNGWPEGYILETARAHW